MNFWQALREILIDELHSHLYLKSVFTNSRWVAYTPNQQTREYSPRGTLRKGRADSRASVPKTEYDLELPESVRAMSINDSEFTENLPDRYRHFLAELSIRANDSPLDVGDHRLRGSASASSPTAAVSSVNSFGSSSNLAGIAASHSRSPESDSFAYIETLLESLAVLGKLGSALDAVAQRLPQEIYALVDSTLEEVSERGDYLKKGTVLDAGELRTGIEDIYVVSSGPNPANLGLLSSTAHTLLSAAGKGRSTLLSPSSLRLAALEASAKQIDHEILKDFFWTLYSKLDSVAQGLGVVSEVANRIGSVGITLRQIFCIPTGHFPAKGLQGLLWCQTRATVPSQRDRGPTTRGGETTADQVWSLTNANRRFGRCCPIISPTKSEVPFRAGTLWPPSTKYCVKANSAGIGQRYFCYPDIRILRLTVLYKHVFRFADGDVKLTNKALRAHEDELNRVLKDTVPGLVPGSAEASVQATLSAVGVDDHLINPGQHHRLLIKPDAFHVSILFQPTLAFLQQIADVLPSGMDSTKASSAVMDDFVLKVYLPQLQEKVTELFLHSVNGRQYLSPDPQEVHSDLFVHRHLCVPAGYHDFQTLPSAAHQSHYAINGIN